jgi:hypothetical protein
VSEHEAELASVDVAVAVLHVHEQNGFEAPGRESNLIAGRFDGYRVPADERFK